ncbi:DUF2141 domain-containing protein [Altererythrobacter aerius]|uniref:DUF2141 domain-containing protein n=1 Tax=Tsuneonella aeria TaxID=1837929 RepID=A0A6I4TH05_9SPHN|nr:DUF2141 domain-containing protein [Tsuneonella aeria]MXO75355.1 DUF2141 domain-containing protein [Tsuneonella aeria]
MLGGAAPAGQTVTVDLSGLRSATGIVRACMTQDAGAFPACPKDAKSHHLTVPADRSTRLTFRNVAPGRYALAVLHDENGNGKADRALGMMPKEGFGFSRDAPVRMAPPKFGDAAFAVGDRDVALAVRMRYML